MALQLQVQLHAPLNNNYQLQIHRRLNQHHPPQTQPPNLCSIIPISQSLSSLRSRSISPYISFCVCCVQCDCRTCRILFIRIRVNYASGPSQKIESLIALKSDEEMLRKANVGVNSSEKDFLKAFKRPTSVLAGYTGQFLVKPLLGYVFGFIAVAIFGLPIPVAGCFLTGVVFHTTPDVKALQRTLSYETGMQRNLLALANRFFQDLQSL
ncbi:hypothetical protein C1H46_001806 [Malus baccata]|uniref:Uncharacterized protein n=1 Tax=Malus baccata TaxID=106549 RepID=A0A540NNI5_MALBA|nr:hypothetical protein C1H46_001806 [Malus baccata]